MKTKVEERFSEFFEKWMCQLHEYLQHLRRASEDYRAKTGCEREQELQASVSKVTQHYKDYYTIKWALAHEDVLAFFCPIWISPLENAYSWVTGWKPSAVLKLVNSIRINGRWRSCKVGGSSEEWGGSEASGGIGAGGTERSNGRTIEVMKAADYVRLRTLKGVLDVLSLLQCVEFLAGIGMLQILLRQWGKKTVCTIN
ncbi:hypothetical protein GH714_044033 [Hevea brasiliensis]|uniref:DOG1 domain-containing protein n=1 Tax=Hevea brasiliensis TaxID=3981 RepID=A0A6A6JZI4_HEVBR|nr:hypothetical protein GH714_044033 [Hevea brasiliensis]